MLVEQRLVAETEDGQLWRITARVATLQNVDYAKLGRKIQTSIDTLTDSHVPSGVLISHTGILPMVEVAQRLLLTDLVQSFLLAVLLICPVMILVLRDLRGGLLSMVPNVAPIIIVFGAMGWSGLEVDVGSVLTASVALGIAVDDTLHYLKWFAESSSHGATRSEAIRQAYRRCAPAMFQTTLICGFGLLVLTQSAFIPTCRFALLVFLLLFFALVADLVLLPAMLAGPLGKYFEPPRRVSRQGFTPTAAEI
jgi:predicted RND superfamily exporter protein